MQEKLIKSTAELDSKLLEKYSTDQKLFAELNNLQREFGLLAGDRPFSPFLRPQFFLRNTYDRISKAAEMLAAAFDKMTHAALANDELMAELGLTETEERYARIDPGYPEVCNSSRLDAFIAGDDFKFLEYNAETPAGITDQMQIEKVLNTIPEIREFLSENDHWMPRPHEKLLHGLVGGYHDFGGKKEKPNIAIVDWEGVSTFTEFEVLQDYFESQGFKTLITSPEKLEYDGSMLRVGDFDVDIFYKRVLIHEFFETADDGHPLLSAYRDGNVFMANSFRTKIPHKKASLAVLRNERFADIFTAEEHKMIYAHLPWTSRVTEKSVKYNDATVDLTKLIRREREKFILKPNDDYGGSGIIIGWESTESEWDAAIEKALSDDFVVQERADVEKVMFPAYNDEKAELAELLIDFDPFIFRGKVEGGLVRLSPGALVNVAAGGGETSMAVIEN